MQVGSFHDFLQEGINPKEREMFGLYEAFASIFPLQDNQENYILEYKSYTIEKLGILLESALIGELLTVYP